MVGLEIDSEKKVDFSRVKAIIFDIEGVIRDSKSLFHHAYESALSSVKLRLVSSPEETWKLRSFVELNSQKEILKALYTLCKRNIPPYQALWKKDPVAFVKNLENEVKISDEVLEKIESTYNSYISNPKFSFRSPPIRSGKKAAKLLKTAGYKICALTNSTSEQIKPWLEKRKVSFDEIIFRDELKYPKPSPDGIQKICKRINVDPKETVYVGDSEIDVLTAINSGVIPVAVNSGGTEKKKLRKLGAIVYDDLMDFYYDLIESRRKS